MSRVSEGSTIHSINYSIGKTKEKLENLQLQGSNLKRVQKPSDDPVGNMEINICAMGLWQRLN
jgi:flagellin-like hook-associated protein FlgL